MEQAQKRDKKRVFLANALLFFLFSFLGWAMEKLLFLFVYGENADRGFLTLPFCPIYGFSLLFIRYTLGIPLKNDPPYPLNMLFLLAYAVCAALIATAAELFTGVFFERVFGVKLWTYADFSRSEYVSLPTSAGWGFLITAAMGGVWAPLEKLFSRAPVPVLAAGSGALSLALLTDFLITAIA